MSEIKKILSLSWSQSGQLYQISDFFTNSLHDVDIDHIKYNPVKPFPFPWTSDEFFDAMPESVLETPVALEPMQFKYDQYDLIILAYQPWYLSPSIPVTSLLREPEFLNRVKNTPVITLIGSRNMWINSQNSVKLLIESAGGRLIANIPFIDRHQNQVSAYTILHWMTTGHKTKKNRFIPLPGISDEDIRSAETYGRVLNQAIINNDLQSLQVKFLNLGLIDLSPEIILIEEKAKRIFKVWAKLVLNIGTTAGKRKLMVRLYKYYLFLALFIVAPIIVSFYLVLLYPFIRRKTDRKKQFYLNNLSKL